MEELLFIFYLICGFWIIGNLHGINVNKKVNYQGKEDIVILQRDGEKIKLLFLVDKQLAKTLA